MPVLFYYGSRSPYPFSTRWLDCFSNPEQAGKVYHRRMAALTLLMKHIRQRDMLELTQYRASFCAT
ncbi:TPA: Rpn family recombination-promoting nuclease/putative transposase [Salmonella enterica subsp. enterica serovar Newport]